MAATVTTLGVLFWNMRENPLASELVWLCREFRVDVAVLAESSQAATMYLPELNSEDASWLGLEGTSTRVQVLARLAPEQCETRPFDSSYGCAHRLRLGSQPTDELLLVSAHLRSRLHQPHEYDRLAWLDDLATSIGLLEAEAGHTRTILVGDLNCDPFDAAMVSSRGLHALSTAERAVARAASLSEDDRLPFFNPMWHVMGRFPSEAAGTYYYDSGETVRYYWHTFDQMLVRPAVLANWRIVDLRILGAGEDARLGLASGTCRPQASDHYPVLMRLQRHDGPGESSGETDGED